MFRDCTGRAKLRDNGRLPARHEPAELRRVDGLRQWSNAWRRRTLADALTDDNIHMARRKKLFAIVAALAVLAVAIGLVAQYNKESRAAVRKTPPAVPVTDAPVVAKTVPVRLYAIGNVEPFTTVTVKARVDGQIDSVHFKEGEEVRQGQLLFEIDPRPFAAALQQAQANVLRDRALLDRAAEQEKRYKDLLEKNFISPDAYGQVKTNMETAAATLRADEAAMASAKLQLDYCTIRSPVTGYAGKIAIQHGNLVKANDTTGLVTINQVVPIYVSFSVPEQNLNDVRLHQAKGELSVQATVPHIATPIDGKLIFIDNSADLTTGTIKLKATFPNRDKTHVARPIRQRRADPLRAEGCDRRAFDSGAERSERPVRIRRQSRSDRRNAPDQGRARRGRRYGRRQRAQRRRSGRHRRPAPPRAGRPGRRNQRSAG